MFLRIQTLRSSKGVENKLRSEQQKKRIKQLRISQIKVYFKTELEQIDRKSCATRGSAGRLRWKQKSKLKNYISISIASFPSQSIQEKEKKPNFRLYNASGRPLSILTIYNRMTMRATKPPSL